jgi:F-type H+-transporting ATPase subunit 6
MLVSHLLTNGKQVHVILRRNIGICAPVLQKATDPIQQLFVDKIREYAKKSRYWSYTHVKEVRSW